MSVASSPVPQGVSTELTRVVERWRRLPLEQATRYAGPVRHLVQHLADLLADRGGQARATVPDLGPGVLMDQLTVVVFDACAARAPADDLESALAGLRRRLS